MRTTANGNLALAAVGSLLSGAAAALALAERLSCFLSSDAFVWSARALQLAGAAALCLAFALESLRQRRSVPADPRDPPMMTLALVGLAGLALAAALAAQQLWGCASGG